MKTNIDQLLKLDGTFNTRDLGGYKGFQGKTIKYHRIYRSDDLFKLTQKDIKILQNIGLKTIVDFRNTAERESRPDKYIPNTKYYVLAPDDDTAALASADIKSDKNKIDKLIRQDESGILDISIDHLKQSMIGFVTNDKSKKIFGELLKLLISEPNNVVIEHCRGGKDRTGFGTAVILIALGVDEETVISDYLLTNKYNQSRNKRRMLQYEQYTSNQNVLNYLASAMTTRKEVIVAGLEKMKEVSGSLENYLIEELNVTSVELERIRLEYLQ